MQYIRFDDRQPRVCRGLDLDEMIQEFREQGESEEAIKRGIVKWEKHHPPVGVVGLYAFLNRPYNIENSVCWPHYAWEAAYAEAQEVVEALRSNGAPMMMCEPFRVITNYNHLLQRTAHHYSESDIRIVWCHFKLNDTMQTLEEEMSEWIPVLPERVDEMDEELLDALEEVFLELK